MRLQISESNFLRVVIWLISIFGVVTLWVRHVAKTRWLNEDLPIELLKNPYYGAEGRDIIEADGFKRRSWFQTSFWLEAAIFLVCPLPFKDYSYSFVFIDISNNKQAPGITVSYLLSDFILVFMFLRLYYLVRAIFNYNMYMDSFAKKLCRSYGFTANVRFTFKALLRTNPARTVSVLMLASVFILAYQLRIFEI